MKNARSKTTFDPILGLYSAAQTLATPVLLLKKWRRFRARGDAHEWDLGRWSCDFHPKNATSGPHLVLVAMGFAETRLAARLTALLRAKRPDLQITWAIRNIEAARQGGAIPENQSIAPFPFEYFVAARLWRQKVRPDAVVFIERFAFPVLARSLHNSGVQVGAVAARSRGGAANFYRRWLLGAFDLLALRSEAEREKLGDAVASNSICVTGSLKFWPQLPEIDEKKLRSLQSWLQKDEKRPLLAAGSTQPGDEAFIFEAFSPLREKFAARLLLAPRNVERADEIEAMVNGRGWKVARRSRPNDNANHNLQGADILLLDTLGELTHAYGAARAAFVGGTLSGTGHNVLEPIAHGIPVFFGPKRGTFGAEQEMCEAAGAGFRVQTPQELEQGFARAISDENWRQQVEANARELNARGVLAWDATVAAILEMMEELS